MSLCFAAAQLAAAALLWRRNTHHDRLYLLVVAPIIAQELSQMAVWLQPSVTAWSFAYYVFSTLTTPCFCLLGLLVSTGASGRRRQLLQAVLAVSGLGWLLCSWLCATSLWDAIALRVGSCGHLAFHILGGGLFFEIAIKPYRFWRCLPCFFEHVCQICVLASLSPSVPIRPFKGINKANKAL